MSLARHDSGIGSDPISSKTMDKPTKILLGGIAFAAFAYGGSMANTYRLETNLRNLEAQCVEEGEREKRTQPDGPWKRFQPLCTAKEISKTNYDTSAVDTNTAAQDPLGQLQWQIFVAHNDLKNSKSWASSAALLIVLFSAVPWVWYFLLCRVRELRDAIGGR